MRPNFESRQTRPTSKERRNPPLSELAEDLSRELKTSWAESLQRDVLHTTGLDERLYPAIANIDPMPMIETYHSSREIRHRLRDLGFEQVADECPKDAALIVLNLPRTLNVPYAQQDMASDVSRAGVHLHAVATDLFWSTCREFTNTHPVQIIRVNTPGEHDINGVQGYYYVLLLIPIGSPIPLSLREIPIEDWE